MKRAWLVSMVLLSTAAGSARGDPATTVSVPGASRARVACVDLQKAATLTKGWPALAERAAALKSSPDAAAALLQPLNTKLMAALEKVRVAGGFSLILREGADPFCATDLTKVVAQVVDGGEPVVEGRVAAERLACATAEVVVAAGGGPTTIACPTRRRRRDTPRFWPARSARAPAPPCSRSVACRRR